MNLKEQAMEKMLIEMNEKHSGSEDAIHNWLCEQNDMELFAGILKEDRTIKGAMQYCTSQAKKQAENNVAMIDDSTVYRWVKKYFLLEKVEIKPVNAKVTTSVNNAATEEKNIKPTINIKSKPDDDQTTIFDFM
ncbi:MAG: PcfK-like family protein [Streptococcaceae bacterium]|jgi:hypothetical protein|nr:PcfK-like family protein [Streptococcaceae bacterium]